MSIRPAQNVIQLFGICDDAADGKLRIVMELCTHGSLRGYVKALPPSQVHTYMCVRALVAASIDRCAARDDCVIVMWCCSGRRR
jgi:hypothetical protein